MQKIAYEALRSLQLKVFEYRSHAQTAAEMRAWNQRRHFRALVRVWFEKTLLRRAGDAVPGPEFARSYLGRRAGKAQQTPTTGRAGTGIFRLGEAEGDGSGGEERETGGGRIMGRGDDPAAFPGEDDNFELRDWIPALEAQSNMTPLPGYLSTPSKRAARAQAMVRGGVGASGALGALGALGAAGRGDVAAIPATGGGSGMGGMGGLAVGSTTPATPRTARTILPTRTPLARRLPASERRAPKPDGGTTSTAGTARTGEDAVGPRSAFGRSVFGRSARGSLAVGFADIAEGEGRTPE